MKNKIQEQVLKEVKPDRLLFGGGECFIIQTSLNGKELKLEIPDGDQVLIYSKKDLEKAISRTIELMEEDLKSKKDKVEMIIKATIESVEKKQKANFRKMIEDCFCHCWICEGKKKISKCFTDKLLHSKELLAKLGDDDSPRDKMSLPEQNSIISSGGDKPKETHGDSLRDSSKPFGDEGVKK